jgi:hypothetical protein
VSPSTGALRSAQAVSLPLGKPVVPGMESENPISRDTASSSFLWKSDTESTQIWLTPLGSERMPHSGDALVRIGIRCAQSQSYHSRAIMKKGLFTRRPVPVRTNPIHPIFERSSLPQLFFSGFRCPSDQLRVVALRLSFVPTASAAFPVRFR